MSSTTTASTLATAYAEAEAAIEAVSRDAVKAVHGWLTMAETWADAREAKAVSVASLAKAIGATERDANKVLLLGEAVATLGLPDGYPEEGALGTLAKAREALGTMLGKSQTAEVRAMITGAPEGATAWHVIEALAKRAGKTATPRKPKTDADRLKAAAEAIKAVKGATLDAEAVRALAALAKAVNVIVTDVKATRETIEAAA